MTVDRTHAIVVAIEKYGAGGNLPGPARDAVEFTKWLKTKGVKPENIHLFASPLEGMEQEVKQLGVELHNADHATFIEWINKADLSGDLLLVLWGGHGLCLKYERHLLFADAMKRHLYAITWKDLRIVLRNALNFPQQLCFVDACANHAEFGNAEDDLKRVDIPTITPRQGSVNQKAIFAASAGQRAANPKGRGLFSTVLTDMLAEKTPNWPPDIDALETAIKEHFLTVEAKQTPAFYSFNDENWDLPYHSIAVYEAVLAAQNAFDASDEAGWEAAWKALYKELRIQDPSGDPEQLIRDLARESKSSLAPALAALRDERGQNLFTFAQRYVLRFWLSQVDADPKMQEFFEQVRASVSVGEQRRWAGAYRACIHLAGFSNRLPPALQYLERVAAAANRKEIKGALLRVSDEVAQKFEIAAAVEQFRKLHADKSARIDAALVFAVHTNGGQYTFEGWLWPDGSSPSTQSASKEVYDRDNVITAAKAALKELIAHVESRVQQLRIEVALPRELLCQPVETWKILRGNQESTMSIHYPVVLRWTDRLDDPRYRKQWGDAWEALPSDALPEPPEFIPKNADVDNLRVDLTENAAARAVVALNFLPPDAPFPPDVLDVVLNEGAPIVLWPRGEAPHKAVCEKIRKSLFKHPPREFPKLVHKLQREAARKHEVPCIALLYDDYSFIEERGY